MAQAIGRITKDARVLTSEKGKDYIVFTVAENFTYKNKEGERKQNTSFYNCAYWRSSKLAPYLTKGTIVVITGQISARPFTDRGGNNKASIQMKVTEISLQGGGTRAGNDIQQTQQTTAPATPAETTADLPF